MSMVVLPEGVARADGVSGIIIFAVVYAIVAVLGKIKQNSQKGSAGIPSKEELERAEQRRRARLQQGAKRPPAGRPTPKPPAPVAPRTPGNTQAEAHKLEDLLRVLSEAAGVPTTEGPMGRPSRSPIPSAEEVEDRESLEVEEEVRNLETMARRPDRQEVDFDDEADNIAQRRIKAAQERDRSLNRVDHRAFDERIRKVEADKTAVAKPKMSQLKKAMVWREILGRPVALRDRDQGER